MDYPKSVPNVGLVDGKFIDENTTTGQVGSLIPCGWGNAVTDEILNVIRAGGAEPTEGENNQLLVAIESIIDEAIPGAPASASESVEGISKIATQEQTAEGVDDKTVVTPLKLTQRLTAYIKQATESVFGWAKIATQAQTSEGVDDKTVVTPLKLAQRLSSYFSQATELVFGGAKIATTTQVNAGIDDATIVTPYKLSKGGNVLGIANNGHIKFPGWLARFSIQWSTYTVSTADTAFSFPTTFESMVGCWVGFFPTSSTALGTVEVVYVKSFNNATVTLQCSAGTRTVKVLAIGLIP